MVKWLLQWSFCQEQGTNQRLCEQRQRKIGQTITRFGVQDQESEKLETSLVLSEHAITLW